MLRYSFCDILLFFKEHLFATVSIHIWILFFKRGSYDEILFVGWDEFLRNWLLKKENNIRRRNCNNVGKKDSSLRLCRPWKWLRLPSEDRRPQAWIPLRPHRPAPPPLPLRRQRELSAAKMISPGAPSSTAGWPPSRQNVAPFLSTPPKRGFRWDRMTLKSKELILSSCISAWRRCRSRGVGWKIYGLPRNSPRKYLYYLH